MSNQDAFLTTIGMSELGEHLIARSDNGYNVCVGGTLFTSYTDHPRTKVFFPRLGIYSTAAGRYQILEHEYDAYKDMLNLPDFGPASQDAIALQLIKERHALEDIDAGRFDPAILKCSSAWASFPGNNYHQRQNKIIALENYFIMGGGNIAG